MMLRLAAALILFALPLRAEVEIKEVTSPGGITAWLVEEHELPFTALEIRFKGGTSVDQPGKRGAVNLMTGLIEEGAGDLDAQGFATARDDLAATFSFRANTDAVGVSARFLSENRDQAVALLRSALVEPRFDTEALERVRGQVLSGLASDAKDPNALAGRAFDAAAFGDHPYGTPGDGTVESVTALTREDIVAAHKGALARDRIYVSAVGDITAEDLGALLDRLLGDLPATGAEMPGQAEYRLDGGVTVVEFPTPQAVIAFGHEGITRDDPDFFAAYILNEVLGGGRFGARLMTEVREKRGLTYGIGTYLVPMDHAELYMGRFASGNAVVGQAIDIVKAEWAKAATEGITAEELAATKTYLTGSYPLRFDGNGPIADILVGMQMEDLPIDYPVTRNAKIEAVTLEDIKRVAARVLKPEALHFVVVGQPEGIASDG
ncbi:insulinase family protein [Cereibacter changlensis]|uniref:Insulinase family protein n=1 Tax=Cereibacter changlensis TaxID=402884 RepID=A0A4U0Z5Y4_9RHOB|nr:pitrilysin family protein [Cereibacter changlensis]TKA96933.1 insulinase family protein [Cereibacter changlensis]